LQEDGVHVAIANKAAKAGECNRAEDHMEDDWLFPVT
jgi:hypothetical protein